MNRFFMLGAILLSIYSVDALACGPALHVESVVVVGVGATADEACENARRGCANSQAAIDAAAEECAIACQNQGPACVYDASMTTTGSSSCTYEPSELHGYGFPGGSFGCDRHSNWNINCGCKLI